MIIEKKTQHDIVESDFLTVTSKINQSKLAKLYGLLSNIYRNKIGAIVREYASNAYDANVEAKNFANLSYKEIVNKYKWVTQPEFKMNESSFNELKKSLKRVNENEPVVTGITESDNQLYFYVKDYGIGLSPERMAFIYFNYLDSTKEDTDDEIGGFGIGSKSALAYTHTFYIDTVYNGKLYKYIMSKNDKGIPQGQLLYESEVDDTLENGTTIKIKLKELGDAENFFNEVGKQLSYMDNLYFDYEGLTDSNSVTYNLYQRMEKFNNFKLLKGDRWMKKSIDPPYNEVHLCLGKIAYTIDWTELGMSAINVPIALQFEVGELEPTPSRESIVYSKDSIKVIKDRVRELQDFFTKEYEKLFEETDDLSVFMERRNNKIDSVTVGGINVEITDLLGYSEANSLMNRSNIAFKPFKDLNMKYIPSNSMLFAEYTNRRKLKANTAKINHPVYHGIHVNNNGSFLNNNLFIFNSTGKTKFTFRNNAYFLETKKLYRDIHIIDRVSDYDEFDKMVKFLYLDSEPKDRQELIIQVFRNEIQKYLIKNSLNYDNCFPNPNWEHSFDAGKSKFSPSAKIKRLKGKIFVYKGNTWAPTFHSSELDLEFIQNFKGIVMYDEHENKNRLSQFYGLLKQVSTLNEKGYNNSINTKSLLVFSVSKANKKIMEKIENAKTPIELIKELRIFKRISTALYIRERFGELYPLKAIEGAYDKVDNFYNELESYKKRNCSELSFPGDVTLTKDNFIPELLKVAEDNNLIDESIVGKLEFLEQYANDLEFIKLLNIKNSPLDHDDLKILVDILKLKKKRVSNKFYLK